MNNDDSKISVIVPVYNRESTIERCIDSILRSPIFELIIVDDGSTDSTREVINSYSDKRVKVAYIENQGVTIARNIGLDMATGDYIHFVDSDDYIEPNLYNTCFEVIQECLPDIILFDYNVCSDLHNTSNKSRTISIPKGVVLDRNYILDNILPVMVNLDGRTEMFIETFVWNKLFKRSVIVKNQIRFDESRKRWEDRLFQVAFLKYSQSLFYINQVGYNYVLGHSSFANQYDGSVFEIVLRGSEDYAAIVGDLYCFNTEYSKNYYREAFSRTVFQQFDIKGIDQGMLKEDICKALFSNRGRQLYDCVNEGNSVLDYNVKEAIISMDSEKAYHAFQQEYQLQKKERGLFRIETIKEKLRNIIKVFDRDRE